MIVLGIDPGTATTGWGVVEKIKQQHNCIGAGVITTYAGQLLEKRLLTIFGDVTRLMKKFSPDAVSIEQLFFNTNAKTALLVGQARGVVLLAAEKNKIPLFSYTPLQVKMAVTGYGRADKKQMQEMIKRLLKLDVLPRPDDAADALAIALTHCFMKRFK